jgi:lathosterol oxidase
MDLVHDAIADAIGADKTRLSNQVAIFYGLMAAGGLLCYLFFASCSYFYSFVLNKDRYFPKTISNKDLHAQVLHEIWIAASSVPFMALVMFPCPLFAYRGYSKMYKNVDDYGWAYFVGIIPVFFVFTDMLIYWAHRGLHHPFFYKYVHKLHHVYKFTTPFSSHAFHPLDGFTLGVPYYIFAYTVPMHHVEFLLLFLATNFWTVSLHDQIDFGGSFINTAGHHTVHHELSNYNYGQYSTLWDRIGGTYKPAVQTHPMPHLLRRLNTLASVSTATNAARSKIEYRGRTRGRTHL